MKSIKTNSGVLSNAAYVAAAPGWHIIQIHEDIKPDDPLAEKYWTQPIVAWLVTPDYALPVSIENLNPTYQILTPEGRVYDAEFAMWPSIEAWVSSCEPVDTQGQK